MKNLRTLCAALAASTLLVAGLPPVALAQVGAPATAGQGVKGGAGGALDSRWRP